MEFTLELESGPAAPERARRALRRRLSRVLSDGPLLDLQLIVSELVANSVRHGPGGAIAVRISVGGDGSIGGAVEDGGTGKVAIREIADRRGGYGLRLVDSLADRWGVDEGSSTRVWFEMHAHLTTEQRAPEDRYVGHAPRPG